MTNKSDPTDAAVNWLIRRNSPDFSDWAGLTAWLESDPANPVAFARLSMIDAALADQLTSGSHEESASTPAPANRAPSPWRGRVALASAALAASVALVVLRPDLALAPHYRTVATAPGLAQMIDLGGGTKIAMNGGARLETKQGDPRVATLISGEASFDVVHDVDHPFTLSVGDATIVDVGTRFNVFYDGTTIVVAVAEGEVDYAANGTQARLKAGQQLRRSADETRISQVDPTAVGSWTSGRLIYRGDPLAAVAADLQRNVGVPVAVDSAIAARPVTGVITLSAARGQMPPQLESLLGVKLIRQGKGWLLKSAK